MHNNLVIIDKNRYLSEAGRGNRSTRSHPFRVTVWIHIRTGWNFLSFPGKFWIPGKSGNFIILIQKYLTRRSVFSLPVWNTRRAIAVTPVVCVRVPVTLRQSFICKFFKSSYLDSHSSESIHIWTIGTLEGRLSFHDSWPQGWCPGVGLEVKI